MSFIVVQGQDDHEQADAVLRGVADGLSRLFRVPDHPPGVQELLAAAPREDSVRAGRARRAAGGRRARRRARITASAMDIPQRDP